MYYTSHITKKGCVSCMLHITFNIGWTVYGSIVYRNPEMAMWTAGTQYDVYMRQVTYPPIVSHVQYLALLRCNISLSYKQEVHCQTYYLMLMTSESLIHYFSFYNKGFVGYLIIVWYLYFHTLFNNWKKSNTYILEMCSLPIMSNTWHLGMFSCN